jgi:hypothetical protein
MLKFMTNFGRWLIEGLKKRMAETRVVETKRKAGEEVREIDG